MSQFKSVLNSAFIYTILGFLPMATNFFLLPLITKKLDTEEFGLMSVSGIFQGVIAVFILIGLDAALARYYFRYYKKRKLLHANYSTAYIFILGLSAILFVLLYFFGDSLLHVLFKNNRFKFESYGILAFFLAVSTVLYTIQINYYRNEENLKMFAIIAITSLVLTVVGIYVGVILFDWKAYGNLWGRTMGTLITLVIFLIHYFRNKPLLFRWKSLKPLLKYGVPFVPYFLLFMANSSIDSWMLERKFNLSQLGEYNFASLLASICSVFTYAVYNAIGPRVYKLMSEDESGFKNEVAVSNLLRLFHLVVLLIIAGEIAVIVPVTHFISRNAEYLNILNYVNLLILVWLPHMYYMLYSIPLMFYNKTKFLPVLTFISLLVGVGANLLLIPYWGIVGVCVSGIIIKLIFFIVAYVFSSKLKILHRPYYRLGKSHTIAGLTFISILGIYLFNHFFPGQKLYLLNLIPIGILLISTVLFYKKEIKLGISLLRTKS